MLKENRVDLNEHSPVALHGWRSPDSGEHYLHPNTILALDDALNVFDICWVVDEVLMRGNLYVLAQIFENILVTKRRNVYCGQQGRR